MELKDSQKHGFNSPWKENSSIKSLGEGRINTTEERDSNVAYQFIRLENGTYLENVVIPNKIDSCLSVGTQAKFHFLRLKLPRYIFLSRHVTYMYAITLPSGETISGAASLRKQILKIKWFFVVASAVAGLATIWMLGLGLLGFLNSARWFSVKSTAFPLEV